jgi:hypothetical protein
MGSRHLGDHIYHRRAGKDRDITRQRGIPTTAMLMRCANLYHVSRFCVQCALVFAKICMKIVYPVPDDAYHPTLDAGDALD